MITGFNTDVEHDGVIYHVQTEDKGLESPLILSLVYSGGAILASKRSRYEDLIAAGFSDEALAERLKRQHRLICAAIHAGRLDELKRMSTGQTGPLDIAALADATRARTPEEQPAQDTSSIEETLSGFSSITSLAQPGAYTVHDQRRQSPLGEAPSLSEGLRISLLDEQEFRSGDSLSLRIMVSYMSGNDEKPISGAAVSLKVLGTTFRPQIYSMKTQRDGIANISAQIPEFNSGRAAILIRALANGTETEMRRVIHPSWAESKEDLLRLGVNGETREFNDGISLLELIKQLDLPADRVAIELNRRVVRRAEWATTVLKEGDTIEIVHFVGGGNWSASSSEIDWKKNDQWYLAFDIDFNPMPLWERYTGPGLGNFRGVG